MLLDINSDISLFEYFENEINLLEGIMKIDKMKKEELELLSYKEITSLILEEKGAMSTLDLFTKIGSLLELPKSTIENKIGDYYTTLTTDKNFLLLYFH